MDHYRDEKESREKYIASLERKLQNKTHPFWYLLVCGVTCFLIGFVPMAIAFYPKTQDISKPNEIKNKVICWYLDETIGSEINPPWNKIHVWQVYAKMEHNHRYLPFYRDYKDEPFFFSQKEGVEWLSKQHVTICKD